MRDDALRTPPSGNHCALGLRDFLQYAVYGTIGKIRHPIAQGSMDHDRKQVLIELAQLFNDEADAMEKTTLTTVEHRESKKRLKRIHEVCNKLRRIGRGTRSAANRR